MSSLDFLTLLSRRCFDAKTIWPSEMHSINLKENKISTPHFNKRDMSLLFDINSNSEFCSKPWDRGRRVRTTVAKRDPAAFSRAKTEKGVKMVDRLSARIQRISACWWVSVKEIVQFSKYEMDWPAVGLCLRAVTPVVVVPRITRAM